MEGGCSFIPGYVFEDIAALQDVEKDLKELAQSTLDVAQLKDIEKDLDDILTQLDELLRQEQGDRTDQDSAFEAPGLTRKIYSLANAGIGDAKRNTDLAQLVRHEASPDSIEDIAVNKCYEYFGDVYNFFSELFERNSIDNNGMPLIGVVHYGTNYANAQWIADKKLMIFGDGFARDSLDAAKPKADHTGYFGNFYDSLDLMAHEIMHGITTCVTKVVPGPCETGALVEHIADVFGIMVKQHKLQHTVEQADWLIGQELILPELKDMALRSFKSPGTAYILPNNYGRDKQIAHCDQFKPWADPHINSGILNHAFYLAAMEVGGHSWEKLGKIWWKTLTESKIDFSQLKGTWVPFARKTVEFAQEYGQGVQNAISNAWGSVGIKI
ncbi:hypothetical protein LTR05_002147 [Lithohypha guttulata]|uniref:Uncharacterized protein n=1 Tax=Lithohypha guttulata TaxID=1690604 RepID=A0AAN7YHS6_9EURO|nr:hypothetical protein LTR05_002147 [Lithohypha guttulata]